MGKTAGTILGIASIVIGLILAIYGLSSFFSATGNIQDIQGSFMGSAMGLVFIFIGFVLIIAGGVITYLTHIGKIFSYVAKETSSGIETASHALGKGLASGVKKGWKGKK